jgi:hypothetical protein
VFVDGNHDNIALLRRSYTGADAAGFIRVRDRLSYAPRGLRWTWDGVRFAALGCAYSVDKAWRLKEEALAQAKVDRRNDYRLRAGAPVRPESTAGTMWFPDGEITDEEAAAMVEAGGDVEVLVTHDKPRGSAPGWDRKDFADCMPNQDRISRVAAAVRPRLLVHGHLHHRYTDHVRVDGDRWMRVEGLGADDGARKEVSNWRPEDAWLLLDTATPGELLAG